MAYTDSLKPQMDTPIWEHCRAANVASSALSYWCAGEAPGNRYIYNLVGATFWRYDTVTENQTLLASPVSPALTTLSMRYTSYGGYRGNCLDSTAANKMTITGIGEGRLNGYTVRITDGLGKGQDRIITDASSIKIHDYCVATAAAATSLTDSTKKWAVNQFIGYQCRIVYNTGLSQIRKILYNNTNTLYFQDVNYQQLESWNNTPFTVTPIVTAGSQAHFTIESLEITVGEAWDIQPDTSSSYVIMTGGIWLVTSFATAPWVQFQYYDIATDVWTPKTSPGGLFLAALGTDVGIERTGEAAGIFASGTATAGGVRSLTDSTKTMLLNQYRGFQIRITGGTGVGQNKEITGNTVTQFHVLGIWDITPDTTSTYVIYGNTDNIYLSGNNNASIFRYSVNTDNWAQGPMVDSGVCGTITAQYNGQQPFAVTSFVRNTSGITGLNPAPTAGGTGYSVGAILSITAVTNGQAIVVAENGGVVTEVELFRCGSTGATVASGLATTCAAGSGCTLQVTSVGVIGRATTAVNHNLCTGDSVGVKGCTDATWNTTYPILAADSITTFDVNITAAATAVAAVAQATTVIVDASKNWGINELAGLILQINTAGPSPTTQLRKIISNTATSITFTTGTAPINGTSRYTICQPWCFGREEQYKPDWLKNTGYATGGSTTTLIDTRKNWSFGQWIGCTLRIISGTGYGSGDITITGQNSTTLTFATQTFTPDTTTQYIIADTFGIATAVTTTSITDTTKVWGVNQFAGKRTRLTAGTGQSQEVIVLSNTINTLTFTAAPTVAPDTTTMYCILSTPPKAAGTGLYWIYGTSLPTKGRFMLSPRGGGSNAIDQFDITTDCFTVIKSITPQTEVFPAGTMYAYDGCDAFLISPFYAGYAKLMCINLKTGAVGGCGSPPIVNGAACLGNRLEIITTIDGVNWVYIQRHTGQEIMRTPLWWHTKGLLS